MQLPTHPQPTELQPRQPTKPRTPLSLSFSFSYLFFFFSIQVFTIPCSSSNCPCTQCTSRPLNELPFNQLDDDLFLSVIRDSNDAIQPIPLNIQSLNAMAFDIFELDDESAIDELNDIDPDLCFYNQISNNLNSNYYSENSFHRLDESKDTSLSILHCNIRSFFANKNDLFNMMSSINYQFSVICLSETWLTPDNYEYACIPNYNHESLTRKNKSGGGVSIFINSDFKYSLRQDISCTEKHIESIYLEIDRNSVKSDRNIIIGCVYRPPKASIVDFNESLKSIVDCLSAENKHIYLAGDFNINLLNINNHKPSSDFIEILFSNALFPSINRPTRITQSSATIIDNIFVNNLINKTVTSGILANPVSDHFPVFCITPIQTKKSKQTFITKRIFSEHNKAKFIGMLNSVNWDSCHAQTECQAAFTIFYNTYKTCFDQCFPLTKIKLGYKNKKPWLTEELKEMIKTKNKLYCRYIKSKTPHDKLNYSKFKGQLRSVLRRAERSHYDDLFSRHKTNLRKSWNIIKDVINKKQHNNDKHYTLQLDGHETSDPFLVSESFNKYFVNVGPSLAETIPLSDTDPTSFIQHSNLSTMFAKPTNETEVRNIIRELKNCAPGPDGIPSSTIKESADIFIHILTHIINLSLSQGVFPNEMKIAEIKPLFKNGNKLLVNNYRPISLLPSFSKIFEKCMASRLVDFISKHNILYKYQFGFRAKHSTNMALNLLIDKITKSFDENKVLIGVALDFRKAFDTIDFTILLAKLQKYGIRGNVYNWFFSYLHGRKQFVGLDGVKSPPLSIQCGVPQGSILGPLLFLLYINDLPYSSNLLPIIFADDTNVFYSGRNLAECVQRINSEMTGLLKWIQSNKLSLNVEKTQYIIFSKRKLQADQLTVSINGELIKRVDSFRFLGVIIDDRLSWRQHIAHIRRKVSKSIGILRSARLLLNRDTLVTLYYAFVYPYFNYCIDVWGHCNEQDFQSLFKIQKRIIRYINFSKRNAHTDQLFKSLDILPLKRLYIFSVLVFMFKFHHKFLPSVVDELFRTNASVHSINTRQQHLLHGPRLFSNSSMKSIRFRGVFIWNQINNEININVSTNCFKTCLKNRLMTDLSISLTPMR